MEGWLSSWFSWTSPPKGCDAAPFLSPEADCVSGFIFNSSCARDVVQLVRMVQQIKVTPRCLDLEVCDTDGHVSVLTLGLGCLCSLQQA